MVLPWSSAEIQILHESGKVATRAGCNRRRWMCLGPASWANLTEPSFRSISFAFLAVSSAFTAHSRRAKPAVSSSQPSAISRQNRNADALRPAGARGVASLMVSFIVCPIVFLKTSFLACKKGHDGRRTKLSQKSTPLSPYVPYSPSFAVRRASASQHHRNQNHRNPRRTGVRASQCQSTSPLCLL